VASVKAPGRRQSDIEVLASDSNHFFLYEVYENEAACKAHRETDHVRSYAATAAILVAKRFKTFDADCTRLAEG
jgi:quinol monooxygenase YgiN